MRPVISSKLILTISLTSFFLLSFAGNPCILKEYDEERFVCVCNSSYCDTLDKHLLDPGYFVQITTSKAGLRFASDTPKLIQLVEPEDSDSLVKIEVLMGGKQYQKIIGFGGAFTDATGVNLLKHDEGLRHIIIEQYFGNDGLEYNLGRVPMAGADFSTRKYTYAEVENDTELNNFSLTEEDHKLKIPFIHEALKLRGDLKLFASVWTAPPWMKTNYDYSGIGSLRKEYYRVWANYFIKFLEEYEKQNVTFWTISTQNEPLHGLFFDGTFNCMGWTAAEQREWIKLHLGPKITNSKFKDIKIIMYDDQRLHLKNYTEEILGDPEAAKYISGIGLHWYTDAFIHPDVLTTTHYNFPDFFLIGTEACAGAMPDEEQAVILGSWERAVNYASDIIVDLNNFVTGWIDWNLLLDMQGGPNWASNFVDATIISDSANGVIYKQPMYYAMGHFSKFLPENSVRIQHVVRNAGGVEILSFLRPDGMVTIVLLNRSGENRNISIVDVGQMYGYINTELPANSISTILYNPPLNSQSTPSPETTTTGGAFSAEQSASFAPFSLLFILTRICQHFM